MEPIVDWNMGGFFYGGENAGITVELEVGDFNHDGIDDFVIANHNGNDGEGEVIVVFGRIMGEEPFSRLEDLADDEYIIFRSDNGLTGVNRFGQFSRAISVGDFNGDSIDDIAVSASRDRNDQSDIIGSISIFYGRTEEQTDLLLDSLVENVWDGANFDGTDGFKLLGNVAGDSLGADLFNLGDRDGDGGDELAIASLNTGANPNELIILWSGDSPLDPSQPIGSLPSDRLTVLTDLPGSVSFVNTTPFEAVDPDPIMDLANRQDDFVTNSRDADLGIVFNIGSSESPLVVEGELLMRGTTLSFNDIPPQQSYRAVFHGPQQFDVRGSVVTDINGDFIPELWWPFYDSEGIYFGLDWRYIPNVDLQGMVIDGVPFDPNNPPPFVQTYQNPESDGDMPFAGRNVVGADIYGDYEEWLDFVWGSIYTLVFLGDLEGAAQLIETVEELLEEPEDLEAMMEALFFIATDSNQGLGYPFDSISSPGDAEPALQPGGPTPIFGGGTVDILRNANLSDNFTFDATQWNGTNGYRLYGQDEFGGLAWEQAVGDVTGDGISDFVFSVPFASVIGTTRSGVVMTLAGGEKNLRAQDAEDGELDGIIYTSSLMATAELRAGLTLLSSNLSGLFGQEITAAGDINGDGIGDFIISQHLGDENINENNGEVYVLYGRHNFGDDMITLSTPTAEQGFLVRGGELGDQLGFSVAGIGDVNNDGISDLLFGAPFADPDGGASAGSAFIVYGRDGTTPFDQEYNTGQIASLGGIRLNGLEAGAMAGSFVTGLGDVNGDGIDDFGIGAPAGFPTGQQGEGKIHVVFGQDGDLTGNFAGTIQLDALGGTDGFTIQGGVIASQISEHESMDLNGDGINDILITDKLNGGPPLTKVIFGTDQGFAATINLADVTTGITGAYIADGINPIAVGGDFNGDGIDDLTISSPSDDLLETNGGSVSLIFGTADLLGGGNSLTADITFVGDRVSGVNGGMTGQYVSFAGDVNGDGFDDLLISAPDNSNIAFPGEVYLVFGRPDLARGTVINLQDLNGRDGFRMTGAVELEGFGTSLAALGDIDGDGRDDFAMGLPQDSFGKPSGTPCVSIIFGGAQNLIALDLADGVRDGQIDFHNTSILYTEFAQSLPGNGIWEGSFVGDVAGAGSFDVDGDQITLGDDTILGLEGDDFLLASDGNDLVQGGVGADSLGGQAGADTLEGEEGADSLDGGEGGDLLQGGAGDDTLEGKEGDDTLGGGDDNDSLSGNEGDDDLDGGAGDDSLDGGANDDTLFGGTGEDTLTGGEGADTFVVTIDGGNVTITDFESGTDKLDLSDFFRLDGLDAFFDRAAGSTILSLPNNQTLTIENLDPEELLPGDLILEGENVPASGAPVTFGVLEEDREQTIGIGAINDPEGIDPSTVLIEWLRDGTPIPGANGESYTLTADDVGTNISVRYSYTDYFGRSESLTSTPEGPVAPSNAPTVGRPVILGDVLAEDEILSVDVSSITDADGIDTQSYLYEWVRDGQEIAGATAATYQLVQADVGANISVWVTYTDLKGKDSTPGSLETGPVANVDDPLLGNMSITGDPILGGTLMSDDSNLIDEDGINAALTTYYWTRDGSTISGATVTSYVITEADLGARIFAGARITDNFGNAVNRSGASVYVNAPASGEVAITGLLEEGSSLSADISGIVDPDVIQSDTLAYQWLRDGVEISGAGAVSYLLVAEDVGKEISLRVTYIDEGETEETFVSPAVTPVEASQLVEGGPDPDTLPGGEGGDTILGFASDDRLIGDLGDDTLDGGAGIDTGVFAGERGSYTLTLSPTSTEIEDRRGDGTGTDSLSSIELLEFADQTLNLDIFDGPTGLTAEQFSEIIELYIAYFNRAPDALGLYYWATEFSNGFTIPDMAANFFGQPETQATYAAVLDDQGQLDIGDAQKVGDFVTVVYNNVLGRGPDTPGFDYWVGELTNNPAITPDIFILSLIGGAKFPSNPTAQTALDQAYLATKSDLGVYFSVIKGMSNIDDATAALALFDGTEASRDATLAAMDGHYTDALDPDTGDFLMPLVGVIDDPFGVV